MACRTLYQPYKPDLEQSPPEGWAHFLYRTVQNPRFFIKYEVFPNLLLSRFTQVGQISVATNFLKTSPSFPVYLVQILILITYLTNISKTTFVTISLYIRIKIVTLLRLFFFFTIHVNINIRITISGFTIFLGRGCILLLRNKYYRLFHLNLLKNRCTNLSFVCLQDVQYCIWSMHD